MMRFRLGEPVLDVDFQYDVAPVGSVPDSLPVGTTAAAVLAVLVIDVYARRRRALA